MSDSTTAARPDVHDKLMALLKRRGFLAPSYELYGGVAGFYDYGPLGATLKQNVQNLWRSFYVLGEGMSEIECPNISPEQVFRASGHLEKFADTVVECPECHAGHRGDHLVKEQWRRMLNATNAFVASAANNEPHSFLTRFHAQLSPKVDELIAAADRDASPENIRALLDGSHPIFHKMGEERELVRFHHDSEQLKLTVVADWHGIRTNRYNGDRTKRLREYDPGPVSCPTCFKPFDIARTDISAFNLMFKTKVGPGSGRAGYLRPETAQGMFMDFDWLYRHHRERLPFGVVQLGRAYRNEISPRQAVLRLREFNQMEAEVFFDPEDKNWPRYATLKDRELNLLAAGESEPRRWRMSDAVEKKIIANGALGYFLALTDKFLAAAGLPHEIVRFRQHEPTEKAHYSTDTWDAEFLSPRFGWVEIVGIADRTDYDLKAHERVSGVELKAFRRYDAPREVETHKVIPDPAKLGPAFKGKAGAILDAMKKMHPSDVEHLDLLRVVIDGETFEVPRAMFRVERATERSDGESFTPHVVEPSYGVDRIVYAILEASYTEKEWATLALPAEVSPVKVGVFPLFAKDGLDDAAREIDATLRAAGILTQYDDSGSIGKRYARQDEIGTPLCLTVDYDTNATHTVTLRGRDSGAQVRVHRDALVESIRRVLSHEAELADVGEPVNPS
ncbi:MAG: glycine--tRNA ligase [Thermoplasmatota archaeon]